ncbi:MAG TPA: hypothetical protein DDW78_01605 [Treponema sp.]|nr:hypothetical protein [Treponema sp.]
MGSNIPIVFSALFLAASACSQQHAPDYAGGNGTVTGRESRGNHSFTTRRHEQEIRTGSQLSSRQRIIYADFRSQKRIGELHEDDIICTQQIRSDLDRSRNKLAVWYSISYGAGQSGWICMGYDGEDTTFPYHDGNWEVLRSIRADGAEWTVRRLEQQMTVWNTAALFAEPGAYDKMQGTIPVAGKPETISTKAVAINPDLPGIWWLQVQQGGTSGWTADCGDITVERLGPRFLTPEAIVDWELGWG